MFVQFVHIRIKPGRTAEFFEVFRENFDGTRAEPGIFRVDVMQDREDENHFVIYEAFADQAALDPHRKTAHYARTVEGLKELMTTGKREKDFFRMVMPDHDAALGGA